MFPNNRKFEATGLIKTESAIIWEKRLWVHRFNTNFRENHRSENISTT